MNTMRSGLPSWRSSWLLIACLAALLSSLCVVDALIHHLHISKDDRDIFKIETFGFVEGGVMDISMSHFSMKTKMGKAITRADVGFVLRKATSEAAAQQDLEKVIVNNQCLLRILNPDDVFIGMILRRLCSRCCIAPSKYAVYF
jgi:hypothetical protein